MARSDHILRSHGLSRRRPTVFDLQPTPEERAALMRDLALLDLPSLRLAGEIRPEGKADFLLSARLSAQAVQPCVVTLEPVATVIDEPVTRRFLAEAAAPAAEESEIPEDVDAEPLPDAIDLMALAAEALMLALPLYPRAPGAEAGLAAVAPPEGGADEAPAKPFAALARLRQARDDGGEI